MTDQSSSRAGEQLPAAEQRPAHQFTPGGSGNPHGRKGKPAEPPVPEPESEAGDGAPPILKAMRWAVRNEGVRCQANGLNEIQRKALRSNPVKFAEAMAKFETLLARQSGQAAGKKGPAARDEGHERARALIDELLERWNARAKTG
jgi:hypothetical protein